MIHPASAILQNFLIGNPPLLASPKWSPWMLGGLSEIVLSVIGNVNIDALLIIASILCWQTTNPKSQKKNTKIQESNKTHRKTIILKYQKCNFFC